MKTLIYYLLLIVVCYISLPLRTNAQGVNQQKPDTIIMLTGETKSVYIKQVSSDIVKFVYAGETAEYDIKKSAIAKIQFGSGRVETFNTTVAEPVAVTKTVAQTTTTASTTESSKNKIAVLPFEIVTNDPSLRNQALTRQVQASCIEALRSLSPHQTIQDPMATNTILLKHHFTTDSILTYTPQEWATLLGVEFVIIGSYSIQNKGIVTSGSDFSTRQSKTDDDKKKSSTYGSSSSYTSTSYDTKISLSIYNDAGNSIYADTHAPAFGSLDSYNPGIKWMIKRTPFAKK